MKKMKMEEEITSSGDRPPEKLTVTKSWHYGFGYGIKHRGEWEINGQEMTSWRLRVKELMGRGKDVRGT